MIQQSYVYVLRWVFSKIYFGFQYINVSFHHLLNLFKIFQI